MVLTNYLDKFIKLKIIKHIPNGQDKLLHIHPREYMWELITNLLKQEEIPAKMSIITYLCMNYKEVIIESIKNKN